MGKFDQALEKAKAEGRIKHQNRMQSEEKAFPPAEEKKPIVTDDLSPASQDRELEAIVSGWSARGSKPIQVNAGMREIAEMEDREEAVRRPVADETGSKGSRASRREEYKAAEQPEGRD